MSKLLGSVLDKVFSVCFQILLFKIAFRLLNVSIANWQIAAAVSFFRVSGYVFFFAIWVVLPKKYGSELGAVLGIK